GRRRLHERRNPGLERLQLPRMNFEVRVQTHEIRKRLHLPILPYAHSILNPQSSILASPLPSSILDPLSSPYLFILRPNFYFDSLSSRFAFATSRPDHLCRSPCSLHSTFDLLLWFYKPRLLDENADR